MSSPPTTAAAEQGIVPQEQPTVSRSPDHSFPKVHQRVCHPASQNSTPLGVRNEFAVYLWGLFTKPIVERNVRTTTTVLHCWTPPFDGYCTLGSLSRDRSTVLRCRGAAVQYIPCTCFMPWMTTIVPQGHDVISSDTALFPSIVDIWFYTTVATYPDGHHPLSSVTPQTVQLL